ncbi:hypothetical protein [Amycolatopsis japonica]
MTSSAGLELPFLQLLRLKGRANPALLAEALALPEETVLRSVADAVARGYCKDGGAFVRITQEGNLRLSGLLASERTDIDGARLTELYHEFDSANSELKSIVTAWQMRDERTPNDHLDIDYDNAVVDRLAGLHRDFAEVLGHVVAVVPRLAHYPRRFDAALRDIRRGHRNFVASPMVDSYHQVWFELHEELIGLLGRTRAEEAAAGRAV